MQPEVRRRADDSPDRRVTFGGRARGRGALSPARTTSNPFATVAGRPGASVSFPRRRFVIETSSTRYNTDSRASITAQTWFFPLLRPRTVLGEKL